MSTGRITHHVVDLGEQPCATCTVKLKRGARFYCAEYLPGAYCSFSCIFEAVKRKTPVTVPGTLEAE